MGNRPLDDAIARLKGFRDRFRPGETVDARSGLTAEDLDAIIAAHQPPADLEPGGSLTVDDLGDVA